MSPMNEALNGIFEFYSYFINFIFSEMELFTGVYFGWVIIACVVFGFLIRSVLVLPRSLNFVDESYKEERYGQSGTTRYRSVSGVSYDSWRRD